TTSRALKERVRTDPGTNLPAAREWGAYPILSFREVPVVEVMMMPRPGEPPLGVGESSSVPGTAAIANAIFDATGVRFRAPPFTPEVVRAALNPLAMAAEVAASEAEAGSGRFASDADAATNGAEARTRGDGDVGASSSAGAGVLAPPPRVRRLPLGARWPRRRSVWARGVALAAGVIGVGGALLGWRPAIAPVAASSANVYSAEAIDRGRQLAALGACVVCHTAPGGAANAGGRALATPFGSVYSTNLTPDVATGIGAWSFSAFQRAMREGVSRDGHHLYPAFPYTSFTNASDDYLSALYAYLMVQPAVPQAVPETRLAFPFNVRPLMALWNALYLERGAVVRDAVAGSHGVGPANAEAPAAVAPTSAQPDAMAGPGAPPATVPALWARGAYLVNGLGHCGACHTPRDTFGAEKFGSAYLGGAMVDGWEAPPLTALSPAPQPWSEDSLFHYLRFGFDPAHGSASGPMAPVVRQLAQVDDADLRAMAHYLASFNAAPLQDNAVPAALAPERAAAGLQPLPSAAQRLFNGACAACHHAGDGPQLLGLNLPLALNTKLHSTRPDNLIRVVLEGVRAPASAEIGFMPAFADALDDAQVAQLVGYLRQRFAPGQPAWPDLEATSAHIRATPTSR
ncbi:MAG: c-type cytochrome, partial [Burkholderiaceae bacterium]